jgi:hypothetical protein
MTEGLAKNRTLTENTAMPDGINPDAAGKRTIAARLTPERAWLMNSLKSFRR